MVVSQPLTELQLDLLKVLWSSGEATVQDVLRLLDRRLAQSTVATLLARMEKRRLVTHRVEGRQYIYRAAVAESDIRRSKVEEFSSLRDELFGGDLAAMVSQLLSGRDVQASDLANVKAMIAAKERELRRKKRK